LLCFNNILKNKEAKLESWRVPYAYDAANTLIQANESARASHGRGQPITSLEIKQQLDTDVNFKGFTGQIQFDNGDRIAGPSTNIQVFQLIKEGDRCSFRKF
jgi:ABC-type branched-subunit amino acid transport system substrate-binding protein